jgi:hypothetical protein
MFYTPFTGTEVKPRIQVRPLPAFKNFRLKGAQVAAEKTGGGWTAEFKLPWANFPDFTPKPGEVIGIECELCSSDGKLRVDRTFVYSSPRAVATPSAFGKVRLVDRIESAELKACARVLLPMSVARSANYPWMYATVGISPTISDSAARLEGVLLDGNGRDVKTTAGTRHAVKNSDLHLWRGSWELFDLPTGTYTLEVKALDSQGRILAARREPVTIGDGKSGAGPNR